MAEPEDAVTRMKWKTVAKKSSPTTFYARSYALGVDQYIFVRNNDVYEVVSFEMRLTLASTLWRKVAYGDLVRLDWAKWDNDREKYICLLDIEEVLHDYT